jgi:TonB family protein
MTFGVGRSEVRRRRGAILVAVATAVFDLIGCEHYGDTPPWWPNREKPETAEVAWCARSKADSNSRAPKGAKGRRAQEEIQRRVREKYQQLQSCYNAALQRNSAAEGRVVTRFVIGGDGTVAPCISEATLDDHKALACMLEVFTTIRFPPADGIVTVVYPIQYSPAPPDDARRAETRWPPQCLPSCEAVPDTPPPGQPPPISTAASAARTERTQSLKRTFTDLVPDLRGCYEEGLRRDHRMTGRLLVNVWVGAEGKVRSVRAIRVGVLDEQFGRCALDIMWKARFDKRKTDPFEVRVPMTFLPKTRTVEGRVGLGDLTEP